MATKTTPTDNRVVTDQTPLEQFHDLCRHTAQKAFINTHSHGGIVHHCSDEYVPALPLTEGETLLVDWDCGGGKSCRIRDSMATLFAEKPTARVLLVSVRIVHALDLKQALASSSVEPALYTDYRGEETELMRQQCIVLSAEQLLHVRLAGAAPFDMLVLDEVRSLADKFKRHSTLSSYESVQQLQRVYETARFVVAADADCSLDNAVMYMLGGMASRPVQTLRGSFKQLKRRLYCQFDGNSGQSVPTAFVDALRQLSEGERLAVVCGAKSTAQQYAKACAKAGKVYALYHGGISAGKKAAHFANPDKAWEHVQCVIYNSSVTVGVDPKITEFKKIFMHSHRFGGSLRDLFQGVCRIGRKAGLLTDTTIHCVVHAADPFDTNLQREAARRRGAEAVELPTEKGALAAVQHAKNAAHRAAKSDLETVGHAGVTLTRMSEWFDYTRAAVEHQSMLDKRDHWGQFKRLAEHRAWDIVLAGKAKDGESYSELSDDAELQTPEDLYESMRGRSVDDFFETIAQSLDRPVEERSSDDLLGADVYFAMKAVPTFDLDKPTFRFLRSNHSVVERHVKLRYCKPRDLRLESAARLVHEERQAHPEMADTAVSISRAWQAHDIAARALGVPSLLEPGTTLPDESIAALNEQKLRDPKAPNGALVAFELENAGAAPLTAKLMRAVMLLGGECQPRIKNALDHIASALGMELIVTRCERAMPGEDNARVRNLFKTITLQLHRVKGATVMENILKHYTLWVGDMRVPLKKYAEYSARLDSERAEAGFAREMEALNSRAVAVPVKDVRYELIDAEALQKLSHTVKIEDVDSRPSIDRMVASTVPHPTIDGVLQIETSYHRKYGFGRRYGTFPSLQMAPKRVRGPLAAALYHDIDVVNAHFVIMMQVAAAFGAELCSVLRVVQDRDAVLGEVQEHYRCGRDSAKQLLLSALNGGTADRWLQECSIDEDICRRIAATDDDLEHVDIVQELLDDYQTIRSLMFKKYADELQTLQECVERARPDKSKPAVKRTVFSLCLQAEEDKVLTAMDEFLTEAGWSVDVLVYDGCMVRRQNDQAFSTTLLTECEGAVLSATGYKIQLLEKCLHCGVAAAKCVCTKCDVVSEEQDPSELFLGVERPAKQRRVK